MLGEDDLYGGLGNDTLSGNEDGDRLVGGAGNDKLYGFEGNDILRGETGFNVLVGGEGNDTLIGLGELKLRQFPLPGQDNVITDTPSYYDVYEGGSGGDTFKLLPANDDRGRLFVKGQKFAQIIDFDPNEGDKILLPGSSLDYDAQLYGENNEDTLIVYKENPEIEIGASVLGVSISPDLSIAVQDGVAVVAVLEDITARDLESNDFYGYFSPD